MAEFVHLARRGPVGLVTIARAEQHNVLNLQVKQEIVAQLRTLVADTSVAVIVLAGEGANFVTGTDLAEMSTMTPTDHLRLETDRVFHEIRLCAKPVIAAVQGYALGGGCELALACDLIVADEQAQFGQPEIRVGIMPGAGGTQRLLRTVGRYQALLWCLTGQRIPAPQAYAVGLVSELVPVGQALERAVALGTQIAAMPPLAVQSIREAMRLGADVPMDTALALERRLFERLFDTDDQAEGMRAFLENRKPLFQGR